MRISMVVPVLMLAGCVAAEPQEKPYFWRLTSIDGRPQQMKPLR